MSKRKASLSIDVLIVGGGVAGLACALGMSRAGHKVTVLEEHNEPYGSGCGVLSPSNMTRIFHERWDLEKEIVPLTVVSQRGCVLRYETGEVFGHHHWDVEMMKQTGSRFTVGHHNDLWKLVGDAAKSHRVQIRLNSKVVSLSGGSFSDGDRPSVTLESGETFSADLVIGADGADSTVRRLLFGEMSEGEPMGLLTWNILVPWNAVEGNPELAQLTQSKDCLWMFYGDQRAAVGHYIKGNEGENFFMCIFTPDDGTLKSPRRGSYRDTYPISTLVTAMGECDPRLITLAKAARAPPTCVRMYNTPDLPDWSSPESPVVLISDAVHSLPSGSVQQHSMSIGDAACISDFFSHLSSLDQIPVILEAFEEVRRPRIKAIQENELYLMQWMTLSGPAREARDDSLRASEASGEGVFNGQDVYEQLMELWSYDAVDGTDDWWIKWGMLKERVNGEVSDSLDIAVVKTVM